MKYSISESSRIVGVTRKTLYKHIDKKPISTEKDDNGRPVIDASELIRVYGDQCKFDLSEVNKETDKGIHKSPNISTQETVESAVTKKELELLKRQISSDRDSFEEQIDYLRKKLDESTSESRKLTALITDQSDDNKAGEWQKSLKELDERIANQEKTSKAEKKELKAQLEEKEKKLKEEHMALELEKSKSFLHKLLGK